MSRRVFSFQAVCPAGTPAAAPTIAPLTIPTGHVRYWQVVTPAGAQGFAGLQLWIGGGQAIPENAGGYLTGNGNGISQPIEDLPVGGRWQARMYNLTGDEHTWSVTFGIDAIDPPPAEDDMPGPPPRGLLRTGRIWEVSS